jgi:hypothetical protein
MTPAQHNFEAHRAMDDFAELDNLTLRSHGDVREQDLWPIVGTALSQYEAFWRALIVLQSNRIEPSIPFGTPEWVLARPMMPRVYEKLAMHNYSLFYFTARARQAIYDDHQRLASGKYPHPEIAFFLLQAAVENSEKLRKVARDILRDLGMQRKFPKPGPLRYKTIRDYRDAFTHDPLLGRRISNGRELLPPEASLREEGKMLLWRDIARIPETEMKDELKLEEQLWQRLTTFLQEQWKCLTEAFVQARQCDKFLEALALAPLLPIRRTPTAGNTVGRSTDQINVTYQVTV